MSPTAYPSQQQMRSSLRPQAPPYGNQPSHYYHQSQMNGAPPQTQYDPHYPNQFNQPNMQVIYALAFIYIYIRVETYQIQRTKCFFKKLPIELTKNSQIITINQSYT